MFWNSKCNNSFEPPRHLHTNKYAGWQRANGWNGIVNLISIKRNCFCSWKFTILPSSNEYGSENLKYPFVFDDRNSLDFICRNENKVFLAEIKRPIWWTKMPILLSFITHFYDRVNVRAFIKNSSAFHNVENVSQPIKPKRIDVRNNE